MRWLPAVVTADSDDRPCDPPRSRSARLGPAAAPVNGVATVAAINVLSHASRTSMEKIRRELLPKLRAAAARIEANLCVSQPAILEIQSTKRALDRQDLQTGSDERDVEAHQVLRTADALVDGVTTPEVGVVARMDAVGGVAGEDGSTAVARHAAVVRGG